MDTVMNKQSGLKGICGMNDMRDIHAARLEGNEKAQLAFDMMSYRIKKYVGAFMAVVGEVDAVVFTAGIGENDEHMRAAVCQDMEHLGLSIDIEENNTRRGVARSISKGGKVDILIIPTNEELEIAQATVEVLKG
jgi:acetate kinase